jgi:flavin reductase (DIM6/NTAB) family NADH-FMN oxidoreductase RutF
MIDRDLKQGLGQMMHGVQVVGCVDETSDPPTQRAYTSHWVSQVSFEEPIVMVSISPRHDSFPIIDRTGLLTVSILAGDQISQGQYFSYPGRKFQYIAPEYLETWVDGLPIVSECIAALRCSVESRLVLADHHLLFARVTDVKPIRLREAPLLYSSRLGWRIGSEKAREPGRSIRDELLERLAAAGLSADTGGDDNPES